MSDKFFDLNKDSGIFLYGCGSVGRDSVERLTKAGWHVKGFIDHNAADIVKFEGLPVHAPSDVKAVFEPDDIVVVTLNNGMEHEKVAALLFHYGIDRTIYLPMHVNFSYEDRRLLRYYYRLFSRGDYDEIKNVPVYRKTIGDDIKIINADDKHICFWCPTDYIFIYNMNGQYINFRYCEQYLNLYRWIKDETADISLYVKFIDNYAEKTPERVAYILKDRREMIKVFEDAIRYDTLFFTDAPCQLYWNAEGKCFTIGDGSHRSHFLISKGYKEVPAITSRADFELWRDVVKTTPPHRIRRKINYFAVEYADVHCGGRSWQTDLTSIERREYLFTVAAMSAKVFSVPRLTPARACLP